MNSAYFSISEIRRITVLAVLAGIQMLGASVALAQTPDSIPDFLSAQNLTNTNVGQSALAIQRTCGNLVGYTSTPGNTLDPSGQELFDRCSELVTTANDRNFINDR